VQARSKETVWQNQLNAFSRLDRKLKLSLILNAQAKFRFLYRCLIIYSVKVYVVVVDTNLTMRKEKEIKRNIKPTPCLCSPLLYRRSPLSWHSARDFKDPTLAANLFVRLFLRRQIGLICSAPPSLPSCCRRRQLRWWPGQVVDVTPVKNAGVRVSADRSLARSPRLFSDLRRCRPN